MQDALLVQIALIVSEMPIASQPVASGSTPSVEQQAVLPLVRAEVPVADDVIELRDGLNEVIYQASLKADSAHYVVLNTLRQALVKHLTAVAESGVRLVEIEAHETINDVRPDLLCMGALPSDESYPLRRYLALEANLRRLGLAIPACAQELLHVILEPAMPGAHLESLR